MSRGLSANNLAEINAPHLYEVVLAKFDYGTPIYVHSGIGTITYDGDDYLGVGDFGGISKASESDRLGPHAIDFTLTATDATNVSEGLEAGRYGDVITAFVGYRQDDGTLVADPWVLWKGKHDNATISLGDQNAVVITGQHDLAVLNKKDGGRYTDEDQQRRFASDLGFEYVSDVPTQRLVWGGGAVANGTVNSGKNPRRDDFGDRY